MSARSSSILHAGCPIHYTVRGQGPPALFIQGVGVHGDGWQPQTDDLSRSFTCITFDNRGMGRSQPAGRPPTTELMAADALAILDAEQVPAAHVIGHSLGGVVAIELALVARSRVASLSLLCTFSGGKAAAPMTPRMLWLGLRTRVGTAAMRRRAFLRLVMPPGAVVDRHAAARLADLFGHDLADQPPIASQQLRALRLSDTSGRLTELNGVPTLVMTGAHDPIGPPSAGRALAAGIAGAEYVEVADASHGLPISHAKLTNERLRGHLGRASLA
jgi:pimeloyl-ACP methyl ester carboxylesterase